MSNYKFMAIGGQKPGRNPGFIPEDAFRQSVWMDGSTNETRMFNEAYWLVKPCENPRITRGKGDELYAFISGSTEDTENLGSEIEFQIENDNIRINTTSIVLVPAGAAHGNIRVISMTRPVFCYHCQLDEAMSADEPALAEALKGSFSKEKNVVEKYIRADGTVPFQPFPGFLKLLLWIDGEKLPGAPYMESVWFCRPKPEKDEMDIPHTHEFDEFLGCVGSDPEHPEQLNGEVHIWVDGEELVTTKSFLLCIPKGMHHCPMLVPKMERPIIHFTGGNSGDYNRG